MANTSTIDIRDSSTWPELLTIAQAAQILQCTEATVRAQVESGQLPATRFGPRNQRIYKRDLLPSASADAQLG